MNKNIDQLSTANQDELDKWFNELNDDAIEIINTNHCDDVKNENLMDDSDKNNIFTNCICIEDILKKIPENMPSNVIMQYECSIAHYIQVLVDGFFTGKLIMYKKNDTIPSFEVLQNVMEYFEWISKASEILAKRINQEILEFKSDDKFKPQIRRSSYNFCARYTQCKNYYSKYEIPTCKEHHYVHSILKYDVDSVINYLSYIIKNKINMTMEEFDDLRLSIKTICYVTRHMAKEINYIDYITKNNSETFHRNNPIEIKKKRLSTNHIKKSLKEKYDVISCDKYNTNINNSVKHISNKRNFWKKHNKKNNENTYGFTKNRFSVLSEI
jgi:hypothetical protein